MKMTIEELRQIVDSNFEQVAKLVDAERADNAERIFLWNEGRWEGMAMLVLELISDRFGAPSRQVEERERRPCQSVPRLGRPHRYRADPGRRLC